MPRTRLDSWKSIADYLQRSTRTVQRWHAKHGLPVHHFRGPKGSAFAYPEEIDAWLSGFTRRIGSEHSNPDRAVDAGKRSFGLTAVANELWEIRSENNIESISAMYREAIDEDPGNAAAYAGFANAMIFVGFHGMVEGSMAFPRAAEALRRMSRIGSESGQRKCSAAWLDLIWRRKWAKARAAFNEVLDEGPRTSFALSGRALLYVAEGNLADAWQTALEAWNLNTLARPLSALLCWISYLAGDYDKSLQQASALRLSGGYGATHAAIEALALLQSGSIEPNLDRLQNLTFDYPHDRTLEGALGYFYGVSHQTERALETLDSLGVRKDGQNMNCAYAAALVLIGLGRLQEAIQALEASYSAGSQWSLGFRSDPILKPLHAERHFRVLQRKIGLWPERKEENPSQGVDATVSSLAASPRHDHRNSRA